MHVFHKEIARPGTYHSNTPSGRRVKTFVSKDRIHKWHDNFQKMKEAGYRGVPAPYRHENDARPVRKADKQDSNAFNHAGLWTKTWIAEDGALWGELEVEGKEHLERVGKSVKDVSVAVGKFLDGTGNSYDDTLTHIAIVGHPVMPGQSDFIPVNLSCFSTENYEGAEDTTDFAALDPQRGDMGNQDGTTLKQAMECLAKLGIKLPGDTNEGNFLERLVTACGAIESHKKVKAKDDAGGDIDTPPAGAKTVSSVPIAMSAETALEFAIRLMSENDLKMENGQPWTVNAIEEAVKPEPVQLSSEQQAAVQFGIDNAKKDYRDRLEAAVKRGAISKKTSDDIAKELLDDLDVQFSSEGVVRNQADVVIECIEKLPDGMALNNTTPGSKHNFQSDLYAVDCPEDGGPPSVERQGDIVSTQLANSGL